jgi:hypothetical protein
VAAATGTSACDAEESIDEETATPAAASTTAEVQSEGGEL